MPGETPNAPPGPQVKPPTAAPGRAALLRPPPGFTCPPAPPSWVSPALLRPPPGFHLPSCAPSGFHLPSCAPLLGFTCPPAPPSWVSPALLAPLLGFTCPPAPPPGFHLPSCAPLLGFTCPPAPPLAAFHLPSCAPFLGFTCSCAPPPGFHLPSRSPPSRVSPALPHLGATITLPSHNITKTALDPKPCLWSKMSNDKTNTMSNLTTRSGPRVPGGGGAQGTLELQEGRQRRALLTPDLAASEPTSLPTTLKPCRPDLAASESPACQP